MDLRCRRAVRLAPATARAGRSRDRRRVPVSSGCSAAGTVVPMLARPVPRRRLDSRPPPSYSGRARLGPRPTCRGGSGATARDLHPGHQGAARVLLPYPCRLRSRRCSSLSVPGGRLLYFEKIRVFKAGVSNGLHNVAWNNGIGPRFYFAGLSEPEVMINRDKRGHSYCGVRGEILGSPQDGLLRKHLSRMFSLVKNESQRREDDQIPS